MSHHSFIRRRVRTREDSASAWGEYCPPEPYPSIDTVEFERECRLISIATRAWLAHAFQYHPTLIEEYHLKRIGTDLARWYASISSDTRGWDRICHIPMEVFARLLFERGWSAELVRRTLKSHNKDELWFCLQREQERDHLI